MIVGLCYRRHLVSVCLTLLRCSSRVRSIKTRTDFFFPSPVSVQVPATGTCVLRYLTNTLPLCPETQEATNQIVATSSKCLHIGSNNAIRDSEKCIPGLYAGYNYCQSNMFWGTHGCYTWMLQTCLST